MEKEKRGQPKRENNCNDVRRICQENLKAIYGNYVAKSCVNIFKPSARKTLSVKWGCLSRKLRPRKLRPPWVSRKLRPEK